MRTDGALTVFASPYNAWRWDEGDHQPHSITRASYVADAFSQYSPGSELLT